MKPRFPQKPLSLLIVKCRTPEDHRLEAGDGVVDGNVGELAVPSMTQPPGAIARATRRMPARNAASGRNGAGITRPRRDFASSSRVATSCSRRTTRSATRLAATAVAPEYEDPRELV
jgi:hypothetical protein